MPVSVRVILGFLGVSNSPVTRREVLVSAAGGCVAIASVILISERFIGLSAVLLVASMGATAVLLFALPEGALSQPWNVLGGHAASALVGVACSAWVGPRSLAAALAVGLAIGVMLLLRCVHPPGGATALSAVVGPAAVQDLGVRYVFTPVLLNALIVLFVAFLFNPLFGSRRYPAYFAGLRRTPARKKEFWPERECRGLYRECSCAVALPREPASAGYGVASNAHGP